MNAFPAFIDPSDRKIAILGGGNAALRKARLLIAAGARPTVVWAKVSHELRGELSGQAIILETDPSPADISDAELLFVALDERREAERWARIGKSAGALVNVVDRPDLCDFTTPSIVDRGRLTIAIGTGGAGPVFAKSLREKIEALVPARADALLAFADSYRDVVKATIIEADRRAFWERFFNGPIAASVLAGDEAGAHEAMIAAINTPQGAREGVVHIVGAGPGDPELLTLKALRHIQSADVILYDRLVSDEILALSRRDADRLYVGKAKANHAVPQEEIAEKLIALAHEGKTVVRLKGGDPFVFGRGGEELDALRAAGVAAFVTPGVTAAIGCAAETGLPLTHRDYAQAVTFVTGHAKGDSDPDLDWAALAALKNTLVVYMGVGKAGRIASQLTAHGRTGETPVAVIENGTRKDQLIVKGQLGDLETLIARSGVKGPAILVIGEVAALADGRGLVELAIQQANERSAA
ncbi:MAG: siroheme synthase CysG [Pseudomonadota bacterium]